MPELPDDLYARIFTLGAFTFPLRAKPEQAEARQTLHRALHGDPHRLPQALRGYINAYGRDANGRIIPLHKNRLTLQARDLLREVEQWLGSQKKRRAA